MSLAWEDYPSDRDVPMPAGRQTPFEMDCQRKNDSLMQFRNQRLRRSTCVCGVVRKYHWAERESGRCPRFRSMSLRQWAEWVGVEYNQGAGIDTPASSLGGSTRR